MSVPNGLLYVCKNCGKWTVTPPAATLDGCSACHGDLHHVAINMTQYNGWNEDIQRAFQYNYLIGKYTGGTPPIPGLKPEPPKARPQPQKTTAKPSVTQRPAKAKQSKAAGCGGAIGAIVLRVLIGVVLFLLLTGGANMLSKYNFLQRKADTAINTAVMLKMSPQVGSYMSLDARWVAGPFAWETNTYSYGSRYSSSGSGIQATVSETKYFYVILDDGTVMAIKTTNANEIETLTRMSDWLQRTDGFPYTGEMLTLHGNVVALTDPDIRSYYDGSLSSFGLASGTPNIRYLMLDTTAGREMLYIILGGVVLLVVVVLIIRSSRKKKKQQAAA